MLNIITLINNSFYEYYIKKYMFIYINNKISITYSNTL